MNKYAAYLLISCLTVVMACKSETKAGLSADDQFQQSVRNSFNDNSVQTLLANIKHEDKESLDKYKNQLAELSEKVSKECGIQPGKLIINSYVKSVGAENSYTSYLFQDSKLQVSAKAPQHITDSFNNVFSCYSPQYWQQFPEKVRALSFFEDPKVRTVRFEVIEQK